MLDFHVSPFMCRGCAETNVADFPRSSTPRASARGVYKLPEIFLIGMRTDSLKEIFSGSDQVTLTIVAFLYTQADFEQVEPLPTTKSLRAQRSNLVPTGGSSARDCFVAFGSSQ
jgi:hypothetical protein